MISRDGEEEPAEQDENRVESKERVRDTRETAIEIDGLCVVQSEDHRAEIVRGVASLLSNYCSMEERQRDKDKDQTHDRHQLDQSRRY